MYQPNHQPARPSQPPRLPEPVAKNSQKRRWPIIITVVVLCLLAGAYGFTKLTAGTEAVIQNNQGTTRQSAADTEQTVAFDETFFRFELPADWRKITPPASRYTKFSYQSSLKNADNRYLDIYVDNLPLKLAFNKALAVQPAGNKLTHGLASDNCMTFTGAHAGGQPVVPAKWDGVDFWCDTDTVTRNVIGTSAPGSINKIVLSGSSGAHSFFFVYTDNNHNPNNRIFYKMLDSFSVK